MATLPHGPEWDFELIERYHEAIAETAADTLDTVTVLTPRSFVFEPPTAITSVWLGFAPACSVTVKTENDLVRLA